jgi:hypothetical protein
MQVEKINDELVIRIPSELNSDKLQEILSAIGDKSLTQKVMTMSTNSKSFDFLEEEEELYSNEDLIEKYK